MSNGSTIPFPIVVFGDSIQRGQGLRRGASGAPSHKTAELVEIALAADPTVVGAWTASSGLAVSVSRFAHSGATINATLASASTTITTALSVTTVFPTGEVPASAPTILDQIGSAAGTMAGLPSPIAPSAVNLVILDGGINDVGLITSILNPLAVPAPDRCLQRPHEAIHARIPGVHMERVI